MTDELLMRAKPVFQAAVELSPEERETILSEACGDDSELRSYVESMLARHDRIAPDFIPPPDDATVPFKGSQLVPLPSRIGHYEIVRLIDSGGMGTVYEARQDNPERTVALKVMRTDAISREAAKRFRREIDILGNLNHPGIAHIYEGGEFESASGVQPYFAMEHVEGERLLEYASRAKLDVAEQLELMARACDAVHYAHLQGVVHRDLKPENILVVDLPGAPAQPKVLDFGIAKALGTDQTTDTRSGQIMGTLAYMSPEQAGGRAKDVDERSDIYQLGATAYRLLAGRTVHDLTTVSRQEALAIVCARPPTPLGDVDVRYRGAIETVVGHALERDKRRRPSSALDLGRALRGCAEEQHAQRDRSWRGRLRNARRRVSMWRPPRPAVATAMVTLAVVAALILLPDLRRSIGERIGFWKLPAARNLAVLPFSTVSGDARDEAVARGLSEMVTWRLSLLTGDHPFTVAAAGFVQARGEPPVEEVGAQVGANLAVVGRLARAGGDATVELSLARDVSGEVLRRGAVTGAFDDPMALEYEVVVKVLELADLEVPPPRRRALAEFGTHNPAAYHLYLEGLGRLQRGSPEDLERASDAFEEALSLDADFVRARVGLARSFWRRGTETANDELVERALAECAEAVRLDSEHADAHLFLGAWHHQLGRLEEARRDLERASYLEPTHDDILFWLKSTYDALDLDERLEQLCREAIGFRPHSWQGYRWLGRHYYWESRFEDAIPPLERAIELAPRNYRLLNVLGAARAELGRWEQAAEAFGASIGIEPTGFAHSNLGTAYFNQGFYRKAVEAYESAIIFMEREKTLSYGIFGNLADAFYWAPGEREKAAAQYRRAIEMAQRELERRPEDAELQGLVAVYYAMLGEHETALEHLSQAVALAPDDPRTCFRAARVHQQLGNSDEAFSWLEKVLGAAMPAIPVANHPAFRSLWEDEQRRSMLELNELSP